MIYTALDTFYLTNDQIKNSPSRKDGVDEETEDMLRLYGCDMIQEAGIFLRLPQAVMATGQVLFHRFYCKKSFARFNVKRVAASCLWLAAKLEESPRKIRDVLNVFHRMERRREGASLDLLDPFSKKYEEMKTDLITTERHLLKEMGFICHVEHPHKFIINYLSQLEAGDLMQEAWNMANDSLRTTLCVRFKSEVVACGVVYAAARRNLIPLPDNPPWWEAFDAKKPGIDEVCRVLANLYRQPKPKYIEVGKDSKPFVLTSRAWDPLPTVQDSFLKTAAAVASNGAGNGAVFATVPPTTAGVDALPTSEPAVPKVVPEKNKILATKDFSKLSDDAQVPATNGDARDHSTTGKAKQLNDREEGGGGEKIRDKDRDRPAERERDRDRDWERDRERDRDRARERERERERDKERERVKERDYRIKDRSRDSGHSDKTRHYSSSRERDFQSVHPVSRDKERHRHRHHPYI